MKRRTVHVHDWTMTGWVGKYRYACPCGAKAVEDLTQPQGKKVTREGRSIDEQ